MHTSAVLASTRTLKLISAPAPVSNS
jgi:hypothetical protein